MEVGLVSKVNIDDEMQQAYLDYAMSVIIARALPDARDGLKPVHRRILYAMHDMGLRPDSDYKKSARIVGEVLGKYHPHGDAAVYETMARMAQDFSMRCLLVDGQGNFGSIDGDPPAAMRYTEARLYAAASHMLADINKNTVDFGNNFDGTLTEPLVLPAALPNLLVNGGTGIAVGMATSIPPHNLGEVVDALHYMLENWDKMDDLSVEDLMRFIQGPDFPTGGVILQSADGDGLLSAYSTGRGRVTVQANAHLEEMERGRSRIIVTELPYMTNKASLIERIAELAREERLEGIADLRDESDRQGMRIVIELSKSANPESVLQDLYKRTPMQSTFSIIMLALVDGEPRMLSLKHALSVYVEHRLEIVRRRTEYDLEKARQRAHILEGLLTALKHLDDIIALIRKSADVDAARAGLIKKYKLSEIQAQAILDMPLRRLAALERKKIEQEYKDLQVVIKDLTALLKSPKKMREVVGAELQAVREAYADRRRTHIVHLAEGVSKISMLTTTDMTPSKTVWVSVTADGLISRTLEEKPPRFSGREAPCWLTQANTRDTLYLVSETGEAAALPIHALPESDTPAGGIPVHRVSAFQPDDKLAALFSLSQHTLRDDPGSLLDDWFVLTVTRQGMLKKSTLRELPGASANKFVLAKVNPGDRMGWAFLTDGKKELLLASAGGMAIRFGEDEVRPMGLVAAGVMGIKLQEGDEVGGADLLPQPGEVFLMASDGSAKRIPVEQFPKQGRYGQGVIAWRLPAPIHIAGLVVGKGNQRAILHMNKLQPKAIRLDEAPLQNRATRGLVIQEVKSGDEITRLTVAGEVSQIEAETETPKKRPPRSKPAPSAQPEAAALPVIKTSPAAPAAAAPKPAAKPQPLTGAAAKKTSTKAGSTAAPAKPAAEKTAAKKAAPDVASTAKTSTKAGSTTAAKPAAVGKSAAAKPAARKAAPAAPAAKTSPAKKTTAEKPAAKKAAPAKTGPAASTTKTSPAKKTSTKAGSTAASAKPAAAEKPAAKKATPAKPVAKTGSTAKSAAKSAAARKPTAKTSAADKPSAKLAGKPAPAKPAAAKKTSSAAKPAAKKTAATTKSSPAAKTSSKAGSAASKKPAPEIPAAAKKTGSAAKPAATSAPVKTPAARKPAAQTGAAKKTSAKTHPTLPLFGEEAVAEE